MALYDTPTISKTGPEPSLRLEEVHAPLKTSDLTDIWANARAVFPRLLDIHITPSDSYVMSMGFNIDLRSNQGITPNIGSLFYN
jgi:hypothetical protein